MSNNEGLIIFPKIDSKLFYLIIFIICSLMRNLIPRLIEQYFLTKDIKDEQYYKGNSYLDILSNFIGDFLAGIMIIFNKLRYKDISDKITTTQELKTRKEMRIKFIFYLSIIAIIDFLAQLCLSSFLFSYSIPNKVVDNNNKFINEEKLYFVVLIDIISRYFFSRLFLNSYFYKHHILSIVLTCIGFIPLMIRNLFNIFSVITPFIIIYLFQYIFMTIIYSLEDVLNKICLNQLILRPYELMFYKAFFQIILILPLSIYVFLNIKIANIKFDLPHIFYWLSFIISNIFRTWSLITIIELINPNHLSVLKSSEFAVLFIFLSIINKTEDILIIIFGIICCLISLIGSIIHNEIIIINRYGLLECTDYYKSEMKGFHTEDDLEIENNKKINNEDSLLNDSCDNYWMLKYYN